MAGERRHDHREKRLFSLFAKVCPLRVQLDSIVKRNPPEPDILCDIEGEGPVAFEMLELIDRSLAEKAYGKLKLESLFEKAYEDLPRRVQGEFERNFQNALICVAFHSGTSFRERRNSIPFIFDFLQELPSPFTGSAVLGVRSSLGKVAKRITVRRGDFAGPCFDVEAVVSFEDPAFERIREKLGRTYESSAPLELLAYYELQPLLPDERWLPQLQTFVPLCLNNSRFRRVWGYDVKSDTIKFVIAKGQKQN